MSTQTSVVAWPLTQTWSLLATRLGPQHGFRWQSRLLTSGCSSLPSRLVSSSLSSLHHSAPLPFLLILTVPRPLRVLCPTYATWWWQAGGHQLSLFLTSNYYLQLGHLPAVSGLMVRMYLSGEIRAFPSLTGASVCTLSAVYGMARVGAVLAVIPSLTLASAKCPAR